LHPAALALIGTGVKDGRGNLFHSGAPAFAGLPPIVHINPRRWQLARWLWR